MNHFQMILLFKADKAEKDSRQVPPNFMTIWTQFSSNFSLLFHFIYSSHELSFFPLSS